MKSLTEKLQRPVLWFVLLLCVQPLAHGANLDQPVMLVATDRLVGSPYEQTVVLAVPSGDGQHLGLIVNRPTATKLINVFPDSALSRTVVDPVFFGGPVMSDALFAAIRVADRPSDYSVPLMPGLFLVTDSATVERLVETRPNAARYFSGYMVWGPAQLTDEIRSGIWDMQPADPGILFRANPQQLWLEFARSKRQLVSN